MLERPSKPTTYRFDQLVDQINQRVMPADADVERYVGLEHLDPDSLRIRRWGDPSEVESTKLRFEPGDIIFGKRRVYQRKVAVANTEGICSAHAMVLRAKPDTVLPEFLPFFMQSDLFMERALSISVGSLSPTINWKALAKEQFLLPPIPEQARMVEVLTAFDAYQDSLLALQDATNDTLHSYLEKEWDPSSRAWPVTRLGDVLSVVSGGTPSRAKKEYWGGEIPWVKTGEVTYGTITSTEESITVSGLKNSSARMVPVGTVLVALFGQGPTLGRAAILGIEATTNQACACILPNSSMDKEFVFYFLKRQYQRLRSLARGANQPNLNLAIIKNLEIPLLSISNQIKLREDAKAIEQKCAAIKSRLVEFHLLKSSLNRRIFGEV